MPNEHEKNTDRHRVVDPYAALLRGLDALNATPQLGFTYLRLCMNVMIDTLQSLAFNFPSLEKGLQEGLYPDSKQLLHLALGEACFRFRDEASDSRLEGAIA